MDMSSARRRITSEPDWYEPYAISLGIRVGDLVFVSGQAAVDERGQTVGVGDFDAQARQVFANLATVLGHAGTGLEHVVKVTILVTDMAVLDRVVRLRREFFTPPYPADTIAQVSRRWRIRTGRSRSRRLQSFPARNPPRRDGAPADPRARVCGRV